MKNKRKLNESPEGDSNEATSDLQQSLSELTSMQDQVEELITTTFDDDASKTLFLMKDKLSFVITTINSLIAKETESPVIEEDDNYNENNPTVNMDTDSVLKDPQIVKKMEDKQININLTDDNGNSLS